MFPRPFGPIWQYAVATINRSTKALPSLDLFRRAAVFFSQQHECRSGDERGH
jgi:hypothetical protein